MASENKEFTLSVFETLSTPWVDVGIDLSEESIDDLIDNEALKTIPFMKTGIALCKAGIQVRDKYLLKQTLKFVTTFNNGTIPDEKLEEYREKMCENPKWAKKEIEHILVLLDAHIDDNQSARLAKFYQAYVKGAIDWNKFCELAEANLLIFESDFNILCEINRQGGMKNDYRGSRLASVGLVNISTANVLNSTLNLDSNTYSLSVFGKTFLQHLGALKK